MKTEIWKPIPHYEGRYEVSSLGRVRSMDRNESILSRFGNQITRAKKGKILKPLLVSHGYLSVSLGARNKILIHRLVAITFLDNPKIGQNEINHINFDRADNRVSNLEWCSRSENRRHSIIYGHHNKIKLCEADVKIIRCLLETDIKRLFICERFGISYATLKNIKRKNTWKWVK